MSNHDPRRGRSTDGRQPSVFRGSLAASHTAIDDDDPEATDHVLIKRTQEYLDRRSNVRPSTNIPQGSSATSFHGNPAAAAEEFASSLHQPSADDDDLEAFWNDFHCRYDPLVTRFVGFQLSDTAEFVPATDFDDCVQESWITITRALGRFEAVRERGKFRWWVFGIVHDTVVDYWRRRHMRESHVELTSDSCVLNASTPASRAAAHADRELLRELVLTALDSLRSELSATNYSVVYLRFVAGHSVGEVAGQLSLAPREVTIRQSRALKKLREALVLFSTDQ